MNDFANDLRVQICTQKKLYLLKDLDKIEYEYTIKKISEKEYFYRLNYLQKRIYHKNYYVEKSKPDYKLKSKCLLSGQYNLVKSVNRILFNYSCGEISSIDLADKYEELNSLIDYTLFAECEKMLKADYQKRKRLRERVSYLLSSGKCYFITLTFDDSCLNSTQEYVRRKYVQQWLKLNSYNYVGNIDYGKQNGREHYHALIRADDVCHFSWIYGFIDFQEINYFNSKERLAEYILKLCNHAIKETTCRKALLYPKKKKEV